MNFSKKQLRFGISIIVLILISYFSFLNDYFKYLEVKRKGNSNACNEYYNQVSRVNHYPLYTMIKAIDITKT